MKKLILIPLAIILSNCEIKVKESQATSSSSECPLYHEQTHNGMTYAVWSEYQAGTAVVNLTKEKLEVELLQLQIAQLKK